MNIKAYLRQKGSALSLVISLTLLFLSLLLSNLYIHTDIISNRLENRITHRMTILDSYAKMAMESSPSEILESAALPSDMVIYKYKYDTLKVWKNQFPVKNDDINNIQIFQILSSHNYSLNSPLAQARDYAQYLNLGSKWYLIKSISDNSGERIIAGLEIKDIHKENSQTGENGVNPKLRLIPRYNIYPINSSTGTVIYFEGKAIFKLLSESTHNINTLAGAILRLLTIFFFSISLAIYLRRHRSFKLYFATIIYLGIIGYLSYLGLQQLGGLTSFFSPSIYADGKFLSSIGVLTIYNIIIIIFIVCTYNIKGLLFKKLFKNKSIIFKILYGIIISSILISLYIYIFITLRSLIINSNISLDLYRWYNVSFYTFLVYVTYMSLLFSGILLARMLTPIFTGSDFNIFTKKTLFIFSLLCSIFFTAMTGVFGHKKEENRITVWGNRMAVDRDLGLEIQLRAVEGSIAGDPNIAFLSNKEENISIITNRLIENYLGRMTTKYYIKIYLQNNYNLNNIDFINKRIQDGEAIYSNSHFTHAFDNNHRSSYIGQFLYYTKEIGISRLYIILEPKANRDFSGYNGIFKNRLELDEINIPNYYSYAKYISNKLVSNTGNYPYPILMDPKVLDIINSGQTKFIYNDYFHYFNKISEDEYIFISRIKGGVLNYFVTFTYLILLSYLLFYIFIKPESEKTIFKKNYFRSRINTILSVSLLLAMVIMATASVTFVYRRNNHNLSNTISNKISTIAKMVERNCADIESYQDLNSATYAKFAEEIANNMKTDISLYSDDGRIFYSTAPDIYDNMILEPRIDQEAYYKIIYKHQRYHVKKEHYEDQIFYVMYAPIFNKDGKMISIVSAPYTKEYSTFNRDAFFHAATIINLFLILIIIVLLISTRVVNGIFRPLIIMGEKMTSANINGFEYIEYEREDEISNLIEAYNRMITDLSISTKQLAQAERDKAWSEMARQVAHEIKNPLTPIKLEIQRLIRLKEKNNPAWSEKFDSVSHIILEHIDILTDTANEFSTFAKLYSEDPVTLDLDKVLKDQIMIFDNRSNINFTYFSMPNSIIRLPKPQIIRVFVNLITNAIQAVEAAQNDNTENNPNTTNPPRDIYICLRNNTKEGYYDIAVDDSGFGVKEDNQDKLFTPNFTTKSGGTGLGLAICRNIVEKCNGSIFYKKSLILGGACFTVRLPKNIDNKELL